MFEKIQITFEKNKVLNWVKRSWLTILVVALLANFAFAGGSYAAISQPSGVPWTFGSLDSTVQTIFNVVILVSGIIFVVLLLVGGIQYLTASGNEESSGKARKLLLDAIIGLIIVLAAWAIGGWIIEQLTGGRQVGE